MCGCAHINITHLSGRWFYGGVCVSVCEWRACTRKHRQHRISRTAMLCARCEHVEVGWLCISRSMEHRHTAIIAALRARAPEPEHRGARRATHSYVQRVFLSIVHDRYTLSRIHTHTNTRTAVRDHNIRDLPCVPVHKHTRYMLPLARRACARCSFTDGATRQCIPADAGTSALSRASRNEIVDRAFDAYA